MDPFQESLVSQGAEERDSKLAEAERMRLLLEFLPECVKTLDRECRLVLLNPAGQRMIETEGQDWRGKSLLELILPGHREAFRSLVQRVLRGERGSLEFELEGLKGRRSWVLSHLTPLPDPQGKISAALGVMFDLSERRSAEARIREREELLERVLATLPVGVWIMDRTGFIVQGNPAGREIWAGARHVGSERYCEFKGWWADTGRRIEPEEWAAARALRSGETSLREQIEIETFDGTRKRILNSAVPLRDENGAITGVIVVNEDVTAQRRAEQTLRQRERELRQAQKLEALGRLAGGVAHDFNNLLTGILGFSELVLRTLSESDARRGQIKEIQQAGRRAATLTRQLLAFGRRQELEPTVLDVNALVSNLSPMLGQLLGEHIQLHSELQPELWPVRIDAGQLERVLVNLALNASDAMQAGGKLELRTKNLALDEEAAKDRGVAPGRFVCLQVRDSGSGMTPEVLERIFDPFFTTKPTGEGTGLGLSTVHGLMEQSAGHVAATSTPGKGSTFTLLLPRVEGELETSRPAEASGPPSLDGKTVLVVEDEEGVLALVKVVLAASGCNVLAAQSPEEALRLCREHEGAIDLCLVDVVMPGMFGPEVMARVKVLRPTTRALFMSGHSQQAIFQSGVQASGVDLILKPFAPSELAARVWQALNR